MSQSDLKTRFSKLVTEGMKAAGANYVIADEFDCVIIRDNIVEFGNEIQIFKADDPEIPFASFPCDAVVSAAAFICSHIVSATIARAIEACEDL